MQETAPDFAFILNVLLNYEVEFIVVGGVCAVLLGAPVTTFDLDIVHSRSKDNLNRLDRALTELDAVYREHLPRRLTPSIESLDSSGHHLLMTKSGPLDILGSIGIGEEFEQLQPNIESIIMDNSKSLNILDLDRLIDVKQATVRPKDIPMLEILKAMKEQRKIKE